MFGGSPKCPACNKAVYWNERVRALDEDWHKTCFKCGNCAKVLALGQQTEHAGKPYCKPCHGKLFGPKGFGFGSALNDTGLRGDGEEVDYAQNTATRDQVRKARGTTTEKGKGAAPKASKKAASDDEEDE